MSFFKATPRKLKTLVDLERCEHAVVLPIGVPVRIHAENGGYLFSLYTDETGTYRFRDKRWGDRRRHIARRVTWEQPI